MVSVFSETEVSDLICLLSLLTITNISLQAKVIRTSLWQHCSPVEMMVQACAN